MTKKKAATVDISPSSGILSVLQHVNYKPWNALAEYIDNSLQSSIDKKKELNRLYKGSYKLEVSIKVEEMLNQIEIVDNAAGISVEHFPHAFRTAKVPVNREGLSEFGMGMKCASCWFGKNWQVKTKYLGDDVERVIDFDVDAIVRNESTEIPYDENLVGNIKPYTKIYLRDLDKVPKGKTISKIKEYLADIYRNFIREEKMVLRFNGEALQYEAPQILVAPYPYDSKNTPQEWRIDINFKLNDGQTVSGFAAILKKGTRTRSGFALFRRGRVIQGSCDDGYRPKKIFGDQSTYRYLRIFGELNLDAFGVSHTKDGFKWGESEEEFISKLEAELKKQKEFLRQVENYRTRNIVEDNLERLQKAMASTAEGLSSKRLQEVIEAVQCRDRSLVGEQEFSYIHHSTRLLDFLGIKWKVNLRFYENEEVHDWIIVATKPQPAEFKEIEIDIALNHKIMLEYEAIGKETHDLLLKFATSIGVASYVAKLLGVKDTSIFVDALNELASQYIVKKENE